MREVGNREGSISINAIGERRVDGMCLSGVYCLQSPSNQVHVYAQCIPTDIYKA